MIETMIFVFGTVLGSFLNVCIHRFPREESIVLPSSHCPACKSPVKWYDNIPLLSYLFLRGRCRTCRAVISIRYFIVELVTGLVWVSVWLWYGFSGVALAAGIFFSLLLSVSATDFETGFIPDKFTLPGMAAGLALSGFFPNLHGKTLWYDGLAVSTAGLFAGGGIILVTGLIGNYFFKKESMGGGDIKLLAMMGAFIGVKKVILVFLLAPIVAIPFALYIRFVRKIETIPFGPFLALTGLWMFLRGNEVARFLFHI